MSAAADKMNHTTCACRRPHVCTCGHHQSVHAYDPADQGRAPPKFCGVPDCDCRRYVDAQMERARVKAEQARARFEAHLQAARKAYGSP